MPIMISLDSRHPAASRLSALLGLGLWSVMSLLAISVAGQETEAKASWQGKTMGPIDWSVTVVGPAADVEAADLEPLIQATLDRVNERMSTYRDDSDVTRFNRST